MGGMITQDKNERGIKGLKGGPNKNINILSKCKVL